MLILVNGEERTARFARDDGTELAFACGKPQAFYSPTDLGRTDADHWLTAFNDHWRRPLLFVLDARDGENSGRACFVLKPGASRRLRVARGPVWRVEPRLMPWADYPAWTRRAEAAGPPAVRLSCFCGAEADDYLAICEAVGEGFRPSFSTHIYKHARREAIVREGLAPRPNLAGLQTGWMERTAFPDLEAAAACILGAVERMMRESVRLNLEGLCAGAPEARRRRADPCLPGNARQKHLKSRDGAKRPPSRKTYPLCKERTPRMPNAMTPTHVANYFFDQADRHAGLTQLKLQSLCVIAQGWHLALRSKPLFAEPVRARAYGPVVDSLFHEFKRFGAAPMFQRRSYAFDLEQGALTCPRPDDPQVADVLERVWEIHKPFTGEDLYETLRGLEAPWHRARQAGWETVPECALESWYAERIRTYLENAGPAKEARK